MAHSQGLEASEGGGRGAESKSGKVRERSPQQVLSEDGLQAPGTPAHGARARGHKGTLTWQLLVTPVPSSDAGGGGRWAGSGSDIGLLRVQESERLRGGEAETGLEA